MFANTTSRTLPTASNDRQTHETFHESVLSQEHISPEVFKLLEAQPDFVAPLTDFERQMKQAWPHDPNSDRAQKYGAKAEMPDPSLTSSTGSYEKRSSWMKGLKTIVRSVSLKKRPRVAGAVTASETEDAATVGVGATATIPKRLPKKSRSNQDS